MPELPEVESIARTLRQGSTDAPPLLGRCVSAVEVRWLRTIAEPDAHTFAELLVGQCVRAVQRHGKYLRIVLDAHELLVHLRMSGRLHVVPQEQALTPHTRVVLKLNDAWALRFEDARKFGRMWLVQSPQRVLAKLGPDALSVDLDTFAARLQARRSRLKPLLLDQTFIAGVGNIYADEALHRACLHPLRSSRTLTTAEIAQLHIAVQAVLHEGIAANGASFDWVYPGGHFQEHFRVYGRVGQPCPRCGAPIKRLVIAQRSTYFCERCQPLLQ